MICKRCASDSQRSFNGEIAVHFPGLKKTLLQEALEAVRPVSA